MNVLSEKDVNLCIAPINQDDLISKKPSEFHKNDEFFMNKLECVNLCEFFALYTEDNEFYLKIYNDNNYRLEEFSELEISPQHCENVSPTCCQIEKVNNSEFSIEKSNLEFDFVESSLNFQGNYQNYVSRVLKSLVYIRLINYSNVLEKRKIILPETDKQKTLILDLDETLIHSDIDYNFSSHDHIIRFQYDDQEVAIPIIIRPGLMKFLEKVSNLFELFVFTASKREYADAVLNFLDPNNTIFKMRFYREHCINIKNKIFVKDLRILVNRKPENIIIVDNSMYSFCNQLSNGILINSFYNDKEDRELFNLFNYLLNYIQNSPDSRDVNEKFFNFSMLFKEIEDSMLEIQIE